MSLSLASLLLFGTVVNGAYDGTTLIKFKVVNHFDRWGIRNSSVPDGYNWGAKASPPYYDEYYGLNIDVTIEDSDGDFYFDVYNKADPTIYIQVDAGANFNTGAADPKIEKQVGCWADMWLNKNLSADKYHAVYGINPTVNERPPSNGRQDRSATSLQANAAYGGGTNEMFVVLDPFDQWAFRNSSVPEGYNWGAWPSRPFGTQFWKAMNVTFWDTDGDFFFDVYRKADPSVYIQVNAGAIPTTGEAAPQITKQVGCKSDMVLNQRSSDANRDYIFELTISGFHSA